MSLQFLHQPTVITLIGRGFSSGSNPVCNVHSLDGNFVGANYTDDPSAGGYNILRNLTVSVQNDTHATCVTVPIDNAAPASVSFSVDGGKTYTNATKVLQATSSQNCTHTLPQHLFSAIIFVQHAIVLVYATTRFTFHYQT